MKRYKWARRLLAGTLAVAMVMANTALAATFSDVPSNHWAYESVEYCYSNGLVKGMTETTYAPNNELTGTQFIVLLGRCAFEDDVKAATTSSDTWSSAYVRVAQEKGVLDGVNYVANQPISRYDMAQLIYNTAKAVGKLDAGTYGDVSAFNDFASIPSNYSTAISWCYGTGILNGMNSGYNGTSTMTRAQAAAVIYRFNGFLKDNAAEDNATEPEDSTDEPDISDNTDNSSNVDAGVWAGSAIANDPPHAEIFDRASGAESILVSGDYEIDQGSKEATYMTSLKFKITVNLGEKYANQQKNWNCR